MGVQRGEGLVGCGEGGAGVRCREGRGWGGVQRGEAVVLCCTCK